MFQTDPILWLQSLESRWLTPFMVVVSNAGMWSGYVILALVVTFGINFRFGFALFQMILWNGVLTDFLKDLFALPRPAEVDASVRLLGQDTTNSTPFVEMDGSHFLDLPGEEAIEFYRSNEDTAYGMPSGHVSMATTFWLGSAILLRQRLLTILAAGIILVMAASRMYLGRHFLGDVVAGFMLGLIVIVGVHYVVISSRAAPLFTGGFTSPATRSKYVGTLVVGGAVLLSTLLIFRSLLSVDTVSRIIAANAAFAIIFLRGAPVLAANWRRRVQVVTIAVTLYVLGTLISELLIVSLEWEETLQGELLDGSLPLLLGLLGTVMIATRLRLLKCRAAAKPPAPVLL
jgi:membrane-associated phospholipid phosphatase